MPKVPVQKSNAIMLSVQENQWKKLEAIAQNLSNASTPGYKEIKIREEEAIYKTKDKKKISFVKTNGLIRNPSTGPLIKNNNPLNLAIITSGYFAVKTKEGNIFYTRDGRFGLDSEKRLVTIKGHFVLNSAKSEINFTDISNVSFVKDGSIINNGSVIDKIGIFSFKDEQELTQQSDNLISSNQEALLNTNAKVVPGSIEDSNVDTTKALIEMIEATKAFEQAQKVIDEYEQMKKKTINTSHKNI